MTAPEPWLGDACSLVDAFRRKELSPVEALDACLTALERTDLNPVAHLDPEPAREVAKTADVSLPFGGVPIGIKEMSPVAGWPNTEASLALAGEIADEDATMVSRLRAAGAVIPCSTTSSEFGGTNLTRTRIHGTTRNPWNLERTPGGSSGGSAAAVAGGLLPLASAGDGGGSIRIPAGFTGLFGLKCTYGRIPKGPKTQISNLTAVWGCVSRSVRDTARYLDVCNGHHPRDPHSLPRVEGWEAGLGSHDLAGKKAAIVPNLGKVVVDDRVVALVDQAARDLAGAAGLQLVDIEVDIPDSGLEWAITGLANIRGVLGDRWPECADQLTPDIALGMKLAESMCSFDALGRIDPKRTAVDEAMADVFDQVDFLFAAVSPDVAFSAEGPLPSVVNGRDVVAELGFERGMANNGALTIPSNIAGNPACSIPAGTIDGLPVGLQVLAPWHAEALLLDLALVAERDRPWPLVAPGSPV